MFSYLCCTLQLRNFSWLLAAICLLVAMETLISVFKAQLSIIWPSPCVHLSVNWANPLFKCIVLQVVLLKPNWSLSKQYDLLVTASTWLQPQHTSETAGSLLMLSGWNTFMIQLEADTLKHSASTPDLSSSIKVPTLHCPCWFRPHANTSPPSVIKTIRESLHTSCTLLNTKGREASPSKSYLQPLWSDKLQRRPFCTYNLQVK